MMSRAATAVLSAVWALGTGCGPGTPNVSPAIMITNPIMNQSFVAGMPITLTYTVGGTDQPTGSMAPFKLSMNDVGMGYGHVEAHLNGGQTEALSYVDTITVPGQGYEPASALILPGMLTIELVLVYNDANDTQVSPQRPGSVTVNIE